MVATVSTSDAPPAGTPRRVEAGVVFAALVLVLALRWHSMGEPIDCDEAAYSYVAHRVLAGDRLYADVFENKPPLAYAPYALAIAVGGYNERAIRRLPVPFVWATVVLVWCFVRGHVGPFGGCLAALLYAVASSDPMIFGNGANLEVYMNPLLVAGLACAVRASQSAGWRWVALSGFAIGAAAAIKQVAGLHALWLLGWLCWAWPGRGAAACAGSAGLLRGICSRNRLTLAAVWVGGALVPWLGCAWFAWAQGVFGGFLHAVFVYGPTLARESAAQLLHTQGAAEIARIARVSPGLADGMRAFPQLLQPWWLLRGNPDATVWWGAGLWPLAGLALIGAVYRPTQPGRGIVRLALAYTAASALAVYWPRLFWQHYYMLLLPGMVILASLGLGRLATDILVSNAARLWRGAFLMVAVGLAVTLAVIQWREYVRLSPEQITTRHKGGAQWCALRQLGTGLRAVVRPDDRLFNWGWQSPLHLYMAADSVTPYFFTDPLLQAYDVREHPLVTPRKQRILADLAEKRPTFVFVGQRVFPELQQLLAQRYALLGTAEAARLGEGRGLYVRHDALERLRTSKEPAAP